MMDDENEILGDINDFDQAFGKHLGKISTIKTGSLFAFS